jgi:hypothetical protein
VSAHAAQFEGWEHGVLDERMVQAMHSGCVVAAVIPDVQSGEGGASRLVMLQLQAEDPRQNCLVLCYSPCPARRI